MTAQRKILLIDDDADIRHLLARDLTDTGKVYESGFWPDAKKYLDEIRFDLIVLDLLLSGATHPLEPLTHIHSIDMDYPVVLISGNKELADDAFERLMRLGINRVLIKPFTREEFLQAVQEKLAQFNK